MKFKIVITDLSKDELQDLLNYKDEDLSYHADASMMVQAVLYKLDMDAEGEIINLLESVDKVEISADLHKTLLKG